MHAENLCRLLPLRESRYELTMRDEVDFEKTKLIGLSVSCKEHKDVTLYFDVKTGEEYWISGPKKNGQDRHWAGSGPVEIDPDVAEEYWKDIRGCEPAKGR